MQKKNLMLKHKSKIWKSFAKSIWLRVGNLKKPDLKKPGFYCWVLLVFFKIILKKPKKTGFFQDFAFCDAKLLLSFTKSKDFLCKIVYFPYKLPPKTPKYTSRSVYAIYHWFYFLKQSYSNLWCLDCIFFNIITFKRM